MRYNQTDSELHSTRHWLVVCILLYKLIQCSIPFSCIAFSICSLVFSLFLSLLCKTRSSGFDKKTGKRAPRRNTESSWKEHQRNYILAEFHGRTVEYFIFIFDICQCLKVTENNVDNNSKRYRLMLFIFMIRERTIIICIYNTRERAIIISLQNFIDISSVFKILPSTSTIYDFVKFLVRLV